jgi:hypothetical protein
MQLSHTRPVASAIFGDPNLVSCAGLVPMVALAQQCDLPALADEHLTLPTDKGANAGAKVTSLVAGMVAGADSIDDIAVLRDGAMGTLFDRPYAPSTLGSFLSEFTFGHVRQLETRTRRTSPRSARTGVSKPSTLLRTSLHRRIQMVQTVRDVVQVLVEEMGITVELQGHIGLANVG